MDQKYVTLDGNEAAALIAHKLNEVIVIYPITPASPMGELSDLWSSQSRPNLWGTVPRVVEMQSEAGAAGAVHGALQTGSLTTTFTASQGLLLMLPNMYKIAGELTPTVFHVAARTVATSSLSIFGDHSDVMAARATGFAMLASASVQEVMDFSVIAQAATLEGRVPVLHFFDGFRTSHEIAKVVEPSREDLHAMIRDDDIVAHRARALSPEHPVLRGSAMNPDVAFQAREASNSFYLNFPQIVLSQMERFASLSGRRYGLFDYEGAPDAERVIVIMGSGAETVGETVNELVEQGERVGVVKVRLFRPFSVSHFVDVLPETTRGIAVLDRTKEPGAVGEPLYQDVVTALNESRSSGRLSQVETTGVIGGRYGLSSKEFTPAMVNAIFEELRGSSPKNHFTVGIVDDVCDTHLEYESDFAVRRPGVYQAVFYGLGSDGTVSANKNSIKIIGEETEHHAQGYFVYDSKKAGSVTVSHLRIGPRPIRSAYLVEQADFVGCHQFHLLERLDVLRQAAARGVLLLNSVHPPSDVWEYLPRRVQEEIIAKKLRLFVVDAQRIAREAGLSRRINTIMQACFFKITAGEAEGTSFIDLTTAIDAVKRAIEKSYGAKDPELVSRNFAAVEAALSELHEVSVPAEARGRIELPPVVSPGAPTFVKEITAPMIAGDGDTLPVSSIPCDGTFPTSTARWEKRNLAHEIPVWDEDICIQCNKCAFVCPHTAIRAKVYGETDLVDPPSTFKSCDVRGRDLGELKFTLQVAPEDCTGCGICVHVCPAKSKEETRRKAIEMQPQAPLRETERANYDYFLDIPEIDRRTLKLDTVRGSQFLEPLFEASGACLGCGETPYLKLISQLFGDRLLIANATGCSSIYCGNLPTTPWSTNRDGRGPAWSNSLFEDNAEFGLGFRLSLDKQRQQAEELLSGLSESVGAELANSILRAEQTDEADIFEQRERVRELKATLASMDSPEAKSLTSLADALVRKSVWIVGGDGWAYDIGYGGLDHVLASNEDVNILVLDTEVYSNTGGQTSKATPRAAVAKFSAAGKPTAKKDLGLLAMAYGNVYVAQVAFGANDSQAVHALAEAERYRGPSLVIAYSHCIAHGIDMGRATDNQKLAVDCGYWPLYRFDPGRADNGGFPLKLDSRPGKRRFEDYAYKEARFRILSRTHPEAYKKLMALASADIDRRWRLYSLLAGMGDGVDGDGAKKRAAASGRASGKAPGKDR